MSMEKNNGFQLAQGFFDWIRTQNIYDIPYILFQNGDNFIIVLYLC